MSRRGSGEHDEEALARLLGTLPPPPTAWVEAAATMPRTRRDAEQIVALAEADRGFREAALRDLEQTLEGAGYDPTPALIAAVRERLAS